MSNIDIEVDEICEQEVSMTLKCNECGSYLHYFEDNDVCCPTCGIITSSKKSDMDFNEEEFRNVLDNIIECMKESKLAPIRTKHKESSVSLLQNVLVVKEESAIGGGLVGSFVRVYAFKGTFDTFENFKKFIYRDSDIMTCWTISDNKERDSELMDLYNEIILKDKANKEFPLYWESGLTDINMSFHIISDIKDGSYIELDTINFK